MAQLPAAGSPTQLRARRWDAVFLGGSLPGLVAAARIGLAGKRVLVIEEEAAARSFPPLREPFLLTGASGGVLGEVLRELRMPLIDVRRLEPDPVAFQLALPEARIDIGAPARTAEELVTWGLSKPDAIQPTLRGLARAAAAERDAMLASPVVRAGGLRRIGRGPSAPPTRHARGMPAEAADAPQELAPFFEAQVQALSLLASADPGPEARAHLLGSALEGGVAFPTSEHTLRELLRDRIRSLHGEFRTLPAGFALVAADHEPGVAPARSRDLWLGRALVLNAPAGLVGSVLRESDAPVPELVDHPPPPRRRRVVHLRGRRDVLPEAMARRVVLVADPSRPLEGTNLVTLAVYPLTPSSDVVDLVAAAVVASDDPEPEARDAEIEAAVARLLPFAEGRLVRQAVTAPRWDDEGAREDPSRGAAWPAEIEVRHSARPPVYSLSRSALGGLGLEGDLLLGWRAGDRIAADLR